MTEYLKVACAECGKRLKVPQKSVGKKARCPKCQFLFKIECPIEQALEMVDAVELVGSPEPVVAEAVQQSKKSAPLEPLEPLEPLSSLEPVDAEIVRPSSESPLRLDALDPLDPVQPKAAPKKRQPSRKELLQRAHHRQSAAIDVNWQAVGLGVGLIILGFVSSAMPDAESVRGGRGVIRLLAQALHAMGPFAPVFGLFLGLGGVTLVFTALKNVPYLWSIPPAAFVALLLIGVCTASFMSISGSLQKKVAKTPEQAIAAQKEAWAKMEKAQKANRQSRPGVKAALPTESKIRDQDPHHGAGSPLNSPPEVIEDLWKRGQDALKKAQSSPLETSNPSTPSHSPDAGPIQSPFASEVERSMRRRPRTSDPGADMDKTMADHRQRAQLMMQYSRGEVLMRFERKGFADVSRDLELGPSIGTISRMGKVFYRDVPLQGVVFSNDTVTRLLPLWEEGNFDQEFIVPNGHVISGLHAHVSGDGIVVGIRLLHQPGNKADDAQEPTTSPWLGREPPGDGFETLDANGKNIYGLIIGDRGFDITGVQLIVEN